MLWKPSDPKKQPGSGRQKSVFGEIASAHFVAKSNGQPIFLHVCEPYPAQVFTLAVPRSERGRFEKLPQNAITP